jgi:hypothetical protein
VRLGGNEYNRSELAGVFSDLGTLIPFVVGYITVNGLDHQGVLVGFGLLALATALYFRTPISVHPMKVTGTMAVTHSEAIALGAIFTSAVVTGFFWLGMGMTGAVSWLAALTSRPVVRSFILEGANFMMRGPVIAVIGALLMFYFSAARPCPPYSFLAYFR